MTVQIDSTTALTTEELDWVLTAVSLAKIETRNQKMLNGFNILDAAYGKLCAAWNDIPRSERP